MFKKLLFLILGVNFICSNTIKIIEIQKVSLFMCFATCLKCLQAVESVDLDVSQLTTSPYSLKSIKQLLINKGWNLENFELRLKPNGSALDPNSNFPILPKCLYLLRL